jgi:hypothetical protein
MLTSALPTPSSVGGIFYGTACDAYADIHHHRDSTRLLIRLLRIFALRLRSHGDYGPGYFYNGIFPS